eukprot:TRINITY_DN37195_c0_g1_i1.p1 TRINITY_DN37195_c0_g1~~TRINITY_DN37195_c0_g1_i1.p1  ORF type:complete len:542 (+),score=75.76 TRINITY_DN37195_c0_g1_i1:37-1662(+)
MSTVQCLGCGGSSNMSRIAGGLRWVGGFLPEQMQQECLFCSKSDEGYFNYGWVVLQSGSRPPVNFKNKRYELGLACSCGRPLDDDPKSREACRKCGTIIHKACVAPDKVTVPGCGTEKQVVCMECYKVDLILTVKVQRKAIGITNALKSIMQGIPVDVKECSTTSVVLLENSIPIEIDLKTEEGYQILLDKISERTLTKRRGDTSRGQPSNTCLLCGKNPKVIQNLCKACACCFDKTAPYIVPVSITYGRESLVVAKLLKAFVEISANSHHLPHTISLSCQDAYVCPNTACRAIVRQREIKKSNCGTHECKACGRRCGLELKTVGKVKQLLETGAAVAKLANASSENDALESAKEKIDEVLFRLKSYHLPDITIAGRKIVLPEMIDDLSMVSFIIAEVAEEHKNRCFAAKNNHVRSCNQECGNTCISKIVAAGKADAGLASTPVSGENCVSYKVADKVYKFSASPDGGGLCQISVAGTEATDDFEFTSASIFNGVSYMLLRTKQGGEQQMLALPPSSAELERLKRCLSSMQIELNLALSVS